MAFVATLSSERYPRANEDWEDLEKDSKSWKKWCKLYKKADMKETIRIQTGGKEAEQFGGAALCGAVGGKEPCAGRPTPATVEDLEGCFYIQAGVGVSEGSNSNGEGGIGLLQFFQHSLTRHRNTRQAIKTTI